VFINQSGNLVFNVHQLYLNVGNVIKLDKSVDLTPLIGAQAVSSSHFLFPDGSSVFIKRTGMLVLRSSNKDIPEIFVPSVLDRALGVATEDYFSGNDYYYREKTYDVELVNCGSAILKVVKEVKNILGWGLKQAKETIDAAPVRLTKTTNKVLVDQLSENLESAGAKIKITTYGTEQKQLQTSVFFNKYIKAFSNHITSA